MNDLAKWNVAKNHWNGEKLKLFRAVIDWPSVLRKLNAFYAVSCSSSNSRSTRCKCIQVSIKTICELYKHRSWRMCVCARAINSFDMPGTSGFFSDFQIRNKSHSKSTHTKHTSSCKFFFIHPILLSSSACRSSSIFVIFVTIFIISYSTDREIILIN